MQTADALLENDRDKAAGLNEKYNEADKSAAKQAKNLPLTPEVAVRESFAEKLSDSAAGYEEARQKAIAADAVIREYVNR